MQHCQCLALSCFTLYVRCPVTASVFIFTGGRSKIYSMPWDLCIQQSSSLASQMAQLFSLLFLSKDLFRTEKELQGCIQLYHLHLHRFVLRHSLSLHSPHESSPMYYPSLCRLLLNFPMFLHKLSYTVRYSTQWLHLTGSLISSFGTYFLCILPCSILPSME